MSFLKIASRKLFTAAMTQAAAKSNSIIFSRRTATTAGRIAGLVLNILARIRNQKQLMNPHTTRNIKCLDFRDSVKKAEPSHRDLMLKNSEKLMLENQKIINQQLFSNENKFASFLVDTQHHLFRDFRKYIAKEDPNTTPSMETLLKFSNLIHKFEIERGKMYQRICTLNSVYDSGEVFNPKSPYAKQVSAGEYIMTASEMTDEEIKLFNVFSEEFKEDHLSYFEKGSVSNIPLSAYNAYVKNSTEIGRPGKNGGSWVQPKYTIDSVFEYNKKFPQLSLGDCLAIKLGMPPGYYDDKPVLAVMMNTPKNRLRLADRHADGKNKLFMDGGRTFGTLEREAISQIENKSNVAIGIWGLPDDHPLHPQNAKVGNYLEVEAFLDSVENVEMLKKSMRTPLIAKMQGTEVTVDTRL